MKSIKKELLKISQKLSQFFMGIENELSQLKVRKYSPNKVIYKPTDTIQYLYYIINGNVSLAIKEEGVILPAGIFVGDYEIENQHQYRTTQLVATNKVEAVRLPIDFYFQIQLSYHEKQCNFNKMVYFHDKNLRYFLKKIYIQKIYYRGELVAIQNGDFALIYEGIFKQKRPINVTQIMNGQVSVEKDFQLLEIRPQAIVNSSVICDSYRGVVFVWKNFYSTSLIKDYSEMKKFLDSIKRRAEIYDQRQKNIKKVFYENKSYLASILPSGIIEEKRQPRIPPNLVQIKKKVDHKQANFFRVSRSKKKCLESKPTDTNLELIPFVKIRRSNEPSPRKNLWDPVKILRLNSQPAIKKIEEELQDKNKKIPPIFSNKFERKMFFKASNPFHHRYCRTQEVQKKEFSPKKSSRIKKLKLIEVKFLND